MSVVSVNYMFIVLSELSRLFSQKQCKNGDCLANVS